MFPLGSALLPGGILPLHVFEERYRQMVVDCLKSDGDPEFGQVLITHGQEAGGGDQRSMVGCVARMLDIQALDEGSRYTLVTVGTRRIRVNQWLPDDPYPRADVDDWPDADPDGPTADAVGAAEARVRGALAMASELGDVQVDLAEIEVSDDPLLATYHLASLAPIGPADRYRLLIAESPADRLVLLDEILDDVEAMLRFRLS